MFRESLAPLHGMLFIFEKEKYSAFWMKNTHIPLDMLWINKSCEIVSIHEHAIPEDTTPILPSDRASFVLEIPSGDIKRYEFKIGQKVKLNYQ